MNRSLRLAMAAASIAGAIIALRWLALLWVDAGRGLEPSDEAFYILSARYPTRSPYSLTDFGVYLSPFWWLSRSSIRTFRILGTCLVVLTSLLVSWVVSRFGRQRSSIVQFAMLSGPITALILTLYVLWLRSPNYNMLIVVVFLLVSCGLCWLGDHWWRDASARITKPQAVVLGILGFLLAIGLPTKVSAFLASLPLVIAGILVVGGRKRVLRALLSAGVGLACGIALYVFASRGPVGTVHAFSRGLHVADLLDTHSSAALWETDSLTSRYAPWVVVTGVSLGLVWRLGTYWRGRRGATLVVIAGIAGSMAAVLFSLPLTHHPLSSDLGWWWIRWTLLALMWTTVMSPRPGRMEWLGPLIAGLGVAAAVGTSNGFVHQTSLSVGLLAVGVVIHGFVSWFSSTDQTIGRHLRTVPVILFVLGGLFASWKMNTVARAHPYRMAAPMDQQDVAVALPGYGALRLSQAEAHYYADMSRLGGRLPNEARGCIVDLTGGTPIVVLALGGRPAGSAWLLGGYPGSQAAMEYQLDHTPCVAQGQIVVVEPAVAGGYSIPRPRQLAGAQFEEIGRAEFVGYVTAEHVVWLVNR